MQRRLDGYTMNELVGFGATGEVWRARPQAGGPDVALRWLAADAIDVDELEASGLRDFRHAHVARLLDIRRDGSSVVLVYEFVIGLSLAVLLSERERLSGSEAVTLLTPLAEALGAAHDVGLLHAHLTPSTVLVTPDGRPILTDLGLWQSRREDAATAAASTGLDYLDPVVARGGLPTTASDVFGLAAIGYHALTGRPPWSAGKAVDTWELAAQGPDVDLGPLYTGAGSKLSEVIARGLDDLPSSRGCARDFAADVRDAAEPEPLHMAGRYLWPDLPPPAQDRGPKGGPEPGRERVESLDIAGEVRRGGSARHAAVPGARRERAAQATTRGLGLGLGLGFEPKSRFSAVTRLVPRRAVISACVTLAVLGVIVLVLGWNASKAVPAQAGALIGTESGLIGSAESSEQSESGLDERAIPDSTQGWVALLTVLYDRRALAFGTGAAALLEQVFTSDSPQLLADNTELARLAQAGEVLRGFAPQVLDVLAATVDGDRATLRITDMFAAYESVPALDTLAAAVADHPGRAAAQVTMTLVRTEDGWRIETAQRLE